MGMGFRVGCRAGGLIVGNHQENFFVYMLLCENGAYYTGYTVDLERRYKEHLQGTAKCKYTRSFKPVCIAQSWQICGEKSLAMKIERFIKEMNKEEKEQLIMMPSYLAELFPMVICTGN